MVANDCGVGLDPVENLLGHRGEPPIAVARSPARGSGSGTSRRPGCRSGPGGATAPSPARRWSPAGTASARDCGGHSPAAAACRPAERRQQGAVGDLGGVVRAAFAVLAFGILIDALAEPVVDPGLQQRGSATGDRCGPAPCRSPSGGSGCARRLRPATGSTVCMIAAYCSRAADGRGLVVGVQQVVTETQVADDERGVRRAVQIADVVEAARVLPISEGVQQGRSAGRAAQRCDSSRRAG